MQLWPQGDNARTRPIPVLRIENSLLPIAKGKHGWLAPSPGLLGLPGIWVHGYVWISAPADVEL